MKGGWFLIKKSKINSPVERWGSVESEQEEEEGVALGEDVGNLLLLASVGHQLGSGDVGNLLRCLLFQIDAVDDLFEAIGEVELGEVGLRTDLLWCRGSSEPGGGSSGFADSGVEGEAAAYSDLVLGSGSALKIAAKYFDQRKKKISS